MNSAAPHSGWATAHARIAPAFALLLRRAEHAKLRIGVGVHSMSDADFGPWVARQSTMITETSRQLESAVARLSAAANAHDPESPSTTAALVAAADDFLAIATAVADWAEAVWSVGPPPLNTGSFASLRAIPGSILGQLSTLVATLEAAGHGTLTSDQRLSIDIQPLLDRAVAAGRLPDARTPGAVELASLVSQRGCGWLLAVAAFFILFAVIVNIVLGIAART